MTQKSKNVAKKVTNQIRNIFITFAKDIYVPRKISKQNCTYFSLSLKIPVKLNLAIR